MLCFSCLWLQGHHKDKNNPQWQICFQKVSHSFSIIPEKYCTIVLTPIECFDRGLMYYPVCPVIQMPPPFVLGNNVRVWNAPLGSLLLYPDTCCAILNFDLNLKKKNAAKNAVSVRSVLNYFQILPGAFLQCANDTFSKIDMGCTAVPSFVWEKLIASALPKS